MSTPLVTAACAEPPGRHSAAKGLHRGVEKVFHPVRHPAKAFLSARNHTDGQTGEQQEDKHGGQHCSQGERRKLCKAES